MNEVVARNNRNFIQSLTSFYRGCFDLNYIEQKASFQSDVINRYPSSTVKENAFNYCEEINEQLYTNYELFKDPVFRKYPYGKCVGVRVHDNSYVPVILKKPTVSYHTFSSIHIFECQRHDCSIEIDKEDDGSIDMRHKLLSPSFEFSMDALAGPNKGAQHLLINNVDFYIEY